MILLYNSWPALVSVVLVTIYSITKTIAHLGNSIKKKESQLDLHTLSLSLPLSPKLHSYKPSPEAHGTVQYSTEIKNSDWAMNITLAYILVQTVWTWQQI